MQRTYENLICIVTKDQETIDYFKKLINEKAPKEAIHATDIEIFSTFEELLKYEYAKHADILVFDEVNGCESIKDNFPKCPVLFILNERPSEEQVVSATKCCYVFDFIRKPFIESIFLHRICSMLALSKANKKLVIERRKSGENIWNLLNYSNLYVLVLDCNLTIKLCSYSLAKILGYSSEDKIIGENFKRYIPDIEVEPTLHILNSIIEKKDPSDHREATFDLCCSMKGNIPVKWFISYANGKINWIFAIGIPLISEVSTKDSIETMRSYYRDVISKDRTMISTIREMTTQALKSSNLYT